MLSARAWRAKHATKANRCFKGEYGGKKKHDTRERKWKKELSLKLTSYGPSLVFFFFFESFHFVVPLSFHVIDALVHPD